MVPEVTDQRWKALLEGEITHKFSIVAASMCVNRNQRMVKRENSQESMDEAVKNLHEFFTKFETIAQDDLSKIFN